MRIERISIARFGALRDLEVGLRLPERGGMVVVEGPNEAGKSTLLRFIRCLLFGGESADGALVVEHAGARYRLAQRGARRTLGITDLASGRAADAAVLPRLVGNLDGTVYRQIFAFGLSELQELEALTGEGVQERIFSAAVSGAGQSVAQAQRVLATETEQLWRTRAACVIRDEARELRALLARIAEAERSAGDYERLLQDEAGLAAAIQERAAEADGLRAEMRRAEILVELGARWRGRTEALQRLAAAPPVEGLPADALARASEARAQVEALRREAAGLAEEVADLERRATAEVPHAQVLAARERVTEIAEAAAVQRQRVEEQLPRLERAVADADGQIALALRPLGEGWDEERVALLVLPASLAGELEAFAEELTSLGASRVQAVSRRREREEAMEKAEAQAAALRAQGADLRWLEGGSEIRRLHGALEAHRARVERLERLQAEVRQGEADVGAVLGRLGPAWDEDRAIRFSSAGEWRRRAEEGREAAEAAAERRRKHQAALEAAEARAAGRHRDLELLAPPGRDTAAVERELAEGRDRLGRLQDLAETLQEWRVSQQDEQARAAALHAARGAVRPARGWVGALAPLVIAAAIAAWVARTAPGAAVAAILGGLVLAVLNRPRGGSGAAAGLQQTKAAHDEAVRRSEELGRRVRAEAAAAGFVGVADLGRVHGELRVARDRTEALARDLDACRQWEQAAKALEQAAKEVEASRAEVEAAVRAERAVQQSWRAWCEGSGVPAHVRPADLPGFLADVERAAQLARERRERHREGEELAAAIADWRAAVRRWAEPLQEPGLASEEAVLILQGAADRAARLGDALRVAADARGRLEEALKQEEEVHRQAQAWEARWSAWCTERGLPALRAPEHARAWIGDARLAMARIAQARKDRSDLEGLRECAAAWELRARDLLRALARAVPDSGPALVAAAVELAADAQAAARALQMREQARTDLDERRRRLAERQREMRERQGARAAILEACGAATEDELAERLEWQDRRREWARTAAEAEDELRRRAGREAAALAARLDEDDPLRWEAERERLRERLAGLDREVNDPDAGLRAQLAAARSRRAAIEQSGEHAALRLRAEQARTTLTAAVRRWVVCRLASGLVGDTLREYEQSHIPEVLRSAGERLAAVTGGRYRGVRAVEAGRLLVDTAGGEVCAAAVLSRGTQEQLYLVVRLGLVDSFARQGGSLPLVLDDVLVNADPERRAGLLRVLAEAAREHQTLLMTCHPDAAAAVLDGVPDAQHVRLERIGLGAGAQREAAAGAKEAAAALAGEVRSGAAMRVAGSGRRSPGAGGRAGPAGGREADIERVVRSLRVAGRALGRRELVAASGIAESVWPGVIRALLDSGRVVQRGARRGAVYEVVSD